MKTLALDCLHLPRYNSPPSSPPPLPLLLPLESKTKHQQRQKTWSWEETERHGQPRPEHIGLQSGGDRITQSKEKHSLGPGCQ